MRSLLDTDAYTPHSHSCFLQASNSLLVLVCLLANVSHTAWLEVKKKKQTQTLCNQVHYNLSLQFKGQQTAGTIIAMGNTSANLLFRLKFSSSVHCVLWMLAKLFFFPPVLLFSYWCCVSACWWCICKAALSDYRIEQHYRLSYHNKLSQSARPTGRTLHQRTKEEI